LTIHFVSKDIKTRGTYVYMQTEGGITLVRKEVYVMKIT